jgi:hypothetical protein
MLGRSLSLKKKTSAADLGPVAHADGVPAAVAEEGSGQQPDGGLTDETHAPTGLVNDGEWSCLAIWSAEGALSFLGSRAGEREGIESSSIDRPGSDRLDGGTRFRLFGRAVSLG